MTQQSPNRRRLLLEQTTNAFYSVPSIYADIGADIFDKILKDADILEHSTQLQNQLDDMKNYLRQKQIIEALPLVERALQKIKLHRTFREFTEHIKESLMDGDAAITLLYNKMLYFGLRQLQEDFPMHVANVVNNVDKNIKAYLDGLSESERNSEANMLKFYEKFKEIDAADQKFAMLSEFFQFY